MTSVMGSDVKPMSCGRMGPVIAGAGFSETDNNGTEVRVARAVGAGWTKTKL